MLLCLAFLLQALQLYPLSKTSFFVLFIDLFKSTDFPKQMFVLLFKIAVFIPQNSLNLFIVVSGLFADMGLLMLYFKRNPLRQFEKLRFFTGTNRSNAQIFLMKFSDTVSRWYFLGKIRMVIKHVLFMFRIEWHK